MSRQRALKGRHKAICVGHSGELLFSSRTKFRVAKQPETPLKPARASDFKLPSQVAWAAACLRCRCVARNRSRRLECCGERTAAHWCPVISEFYKRLRENGKSYNVAIIACARKMLTRLIKQMTSENLTTNEGSET